MNGFAFAIAILVLCGSIRLFAVPENTTVKSHSITLQSENQHYPWISNGSVFIWTGNFHIETSTHMLFYEIEGEGIELLSQNLGGINRLLKTEVTHVDQANMLITLTGPGSLMAFLDDVLIPSSASIVNREYIEKMESIALTEGGQRSLKVLNRYRQERSIVTDGNRWKLSFAFTVGGGIELLTVEGTIWPLSVMKIYHKIEIPPRTLVLYHVGGDPVR